MSAVIARQFWLSHIAMSQNVVVRRASYGKVTVQVYEDPSHKEPVLSVDLVNSHSRHRNMRLVIIRVKTQANWVIGSNLSEFHLCTWNPNIVYQILGSIRFFAIKPLLETSLQRLMAYVKLPDLQQDEIRYLDRYVKDEFDLELAELDDGEDLLDFMLYQIQKYTGTD